MLRLALASRARARLSSAALGGGVLLVVVAATLLASVVGARAARLDGVLTSSLRPAYDLLVRPSAAVSPYERATGLVRDNFLSGSFGGITEAQYRFVAGLPGVEAAPVENVGYVLLQDNLSLAVPVPTTGPPQQLLRVAVDFVVGAGEATYADGAAYVYVTRRPLAQEGSGAISEAVPGRRAPVDVCGPQSQPADTAALAASPYSAGSLGGDIYCFSLADPAASSFPPTRTSVVNIPVTFDFPVMLTAVDPVAEARLFGLSGAVVSGRYLAEDAGAARVATAGLGVVEQVPVLASSRTFLDEQLVAHVARLAGAAPATLPEELAAPQAASWASKLAGTPAGTVQVGAGVAYSELLAGTTGEAGDDLPVGQYWVTGPVRYDADGADRVRALPTSNPTGVWRANPAFAGTTSVGGAGYVAAPPGSDGASFVSLGVRDLAGDGSPGSPLPVALHVVGEFDPDRIDSFPPLSAVPLQTYYPPVVLPGDAATAAATGGQALGPTTDIAGYVQQPPSLVTTIAAAAPLVAADHYAGGDGAAPISAVLVRVTGPLGLGSRATLAALASRIETATGLRVDVMDGSSPTPVLVSLPLGLFREGWTEKGVAFSVAGVLDDETLWLFLVLAFSGTAFLRAVVRTDLQARRSDLATLAALGWRRQDVARLVGGELLAVGLAAVGASALVPAIVGGGGAWERWAVTSAAGIAVLVLPNVRTVMLAGGDPPAGRWARVVRRGGERSSVAGLALANLRARRERVLLAAGPLALGIASLLVVLSTQRSAAAQVGATRTLLGASIVLQGHPADVVTAVALAVLGAGTASALCLASLRQRAADLAVLRSIGWRRRQLGILAGAEVTAVLAGGTGAGVAAWLALAAWAGLPVSGLVPAALAVTGGGALVVLAMTVGPLGRLLRSPDAQLLGPPA